MKFKFIGGHLCLDFINTVGDHLGEQRSEYLKSYEHLIAWGEAAGVISAEEKEVLSELAAHHPVQATRVLKKAITLREVLFEMLVAAALKKDSSPHLLDDFNVYLNKALKHLRLAPGKAGFFWSWNQPEESLDQLIMIITWSAANLLTGENLKHLKVCADNFCGWLFLDTSKNKRRSWCDMKDCGNRNKFRRYYSKQKIKDNG